MYASSAVWHSISTALFQAKYYYICIYAIDHDWIVTVSVCDIIALRQEIKELMELVQKLVTEFQAVKLELEASRLDVDSIRVALCEAVAKKQPSFQ